MFLSVTRVPHPSGGISGAVVSDVHMKGLALWFLSCVLMQRIFLFVGYFCVWEVGYHCFKEASVGFLRQALRWSSIDYKYSLESWRFILVLFGCFIPVCSQNSISLPESSAAFPSILCGHLSVCNSGDPALPFKVLKISGSYLCLNENAAATVNFSSRANEVWALSDTFQSPRV